MVSLCCAVWRTKSFPHTSYILYIVLCIFICSVILVISGFGLEGWSWVLIASVPDLCILLLLELTCLSRYIYFRWSIGSLVILTTGCPCLCQCYNNLRLSFVCAAVRLQFRPSNRLYNHHSLVGTCDCELVGSRPWFG